MNQPIYFPSNKTILPEKTAAVTSSPVPRQDSAGSAARQDVAQVKKDWQKSTNWASRTQQTLEQLQQSYPHITFLIAENLNENALSQTAAALGSGTHIILSQDFLDKMGTDQAAYEKYKGVLIDTLGKLSRQAPSWDGNGAYLTAKNKTYWTVKHTEDLPPTAPETPLPGGSIPDTAKKTDYRFRSKPVYAVAASFSRLSGARNKLQVNTVMSEARRNMGTLQITAALGDADDRKKAKAAISSYNKLLLRGNQKIRRIVKEELLQLQRKKAIKAENRERAMQIKAELALKRAARATSDSAIAQEGRMEDANRYYLYKKNQTYHEESHSDYIPPPLPTDIPSVGLTSLDTVSAFTSGEVMISETTPI